MQDSLWLGVHALRASGGIASAEFIALDESTGQRARPSRTGKGGLPQALPVSKRNRVQLWPASYLVGGDVRKRLTTGSEKAHLDVLRRHRVNQAEGRLLRGALWQNQGLVFANELGRPIEATNLLRRSFAPLLARAGLPRIRFHDLRHSAVTLLLGQGIHPKIVPERLGHSRIGISLDLHSHVTPTMQREATNAFDVVLGG